MMMPEIITLADRLERVETSIASAAVDAGRQRGEINLIAVSKTFEPDDIRRVIAAGARLFGENRVQEAVRKWPALKAETQDIELHLIGPLQTNKVKQALELFDCVHTLDRPKLARMIAKTAADIGRMPKLLVQVNTGEEPQKAGILPDKVDEFLALCINQYKLKIAGLMCIPPIDEEPALHFALLEKIAARNDLNDLSMGMSSDFETAIHFGATYIRVGQAIFGSRTH